jgi:hypothetical protein
VITSGVRVESASSRARITFSIVVGSSNTYAPTVGRVRREDAGADERPDQLGEEERIAARGLDDAPE